MICGHCKVAYHHEPKLTQLAEDKKHKWLADFSTCPSCGNANVKFYQSTFLQASLPGGIVKNEFGRPSLELTYPLLNSRNPCPPEVPTPLAKDYIQACNVQSLSPEASAALSRRCLQGILRDKGYNQHNLADQIKAAIDSNSLPTHISEVLDAVRQIGNFAAHPTKSKSTGEIVEVEPEEAEWNLEVLEALFDFYYVQETANKKRLDALKAKIDAAKNAPASTP